MVVGSNRRRLGSPALAGFVEAFMFLSLVVVPGARAQSGGDLGGILPKTQAAVEKFAEDFSSIRYEEDMVQEKLKENEKVAYRQETVFDSIIRMRFDDGTLRVDEQRLIERLPRHAESRPFLSTYGFSSLVMVFHPYYGSSFRFTGAGDEVWEGKALTRIHFEHVPGTPTPVLYQMIGADKPMELGGTAWVDPASGDIYRIQAEFEFPSDNIGVRKIRAEVAYRPVTLAEETSPRILPATATIDLETAKQHWRNVHHFTDYRKYRVTSNIPGVSAQ